MRSPPLQRVDLGSAASAASKRPSNDGVTAMAVCMCGGDTGATNRVHEVPSLATFCLARVSASNGFHDAKCCHEMRSHQLLLMHHEEVQDGQCHAGMRPSSLQALGIPGGHWLPIRPMASGDRDSEVSLQVVPVQRSSSDTSRLQVAKPKAKQKASTVCGTVPASWRETRDSFAAPYLTLRREENCMCNGASEPQRRPNCCEWSATSARGCSHSSETTVRTCIAPREVATAALAAIPRQLTLAFASHCVHHSLQLLFDRSKPSPATSKAFFTYSTPTPRHHVA